MKITEQDLRERYESLETGQLIELQTQGGLTETAARVLEQVLAERSVPTAERAAVVSEVKRRAFVQEAMTTALASRWGRLVARLIDSVLVFTILILSVPLGRFAEPLGRLGFFIALAYLLFADGLPRGQSLGKRLAGIVVVDRHTKRACSYGESFVRNLLLLTIVDMLFILGRTRRRLGDRAASTLVARLNFRDIAGVHW